VTLTIAYITFREDPKAEWFLDSLRRQMIPQERIRLVIVDYHTPRTQYSSEPSLPNCTIIQTPPKPSVWQGPHRLTKEDWFAASNARNTALCLAQDGYLAYVDDLSVLMPGWLPAVREHMVAGRIAFGAYQKVKNLVVENGKVISFNIHAKDNRLHQVSGSVTPCAGRWLYGCSLCGPVQHFLTVGGWPEFCDGLGFEDCIMGHALENHGFPMVYDTRMMTLESEEHHHIGPVFKKSDYGKSPNDKSHAALNIGRQSRYFENYYEGGIPRMREQVLQGKPFPVAGNPRHCWFTEKALSEL
jgi:glycosyltransferase involved in cell wall biosynthesis